MAGVVQKLLLKRTTAGRRILSTTSLTLFDVLLSMIVLPAAHVLHQSSGGNWSFSNLAQRFSLVSSREHRGLD
jgi:hypothetical protein